MYIFKKIKGFCQQESVLVVATVLALISALWVKPSSAYFSYIDFRVLGILLSLMLVMAGFQRSGFFRQVGAWLLQRSKSTTTLVLSLVFLCFFSSMLITNDVALITFVPFAMLTLQQSGREKLMIPVIVLQTLAANLGSMLTPLGNPQNLYLYNRMGLPLLSFMNLLLPVTLAAALLLLLCCLFFGQQSPATAVSTAAEEEPKKLHNLVYFLLFLCCLLVVMRVLSYPVVLILVIVAMLILDAQVLLSVDYCLLLTFVAFFIFTGNMGAIPSVRNLLQNLVVGRELWVAIASSQIISNVPAALLLADFTRDFPALLLGVNLGGMGTLIASMASLISYKLFVKSYPHEKGRYFLWFTLANLFYLAVLLTVSLIF